MPSFKDLTGQKFTRLLVIGPREQRKRISYWLCRCDCGVEKFVKSSHLTGGLTRSCGCLHSELSSARAPRLHKANTKTGLSGTLTHNSWLAMKQRCLNPKCPAYKDYGGRGIQISPRWINSFESFLADMGVAPKGTTIDRINNNKGYEPGNCRWASRKIQAINKRNTRKVVVGGKEYIAQDLAQQVGLKTDTVIERAKLGLPLSEVVARKRRVYRPGLALGGKASGARQRAKTHCPHGHAYDDANTYVTPQGARGCRTCKRLRMRARNAAKRAAKASPN